MSNQCRRAYRLPCRAAAAIVALAAALGQAAEPVTTPLGGEKGPAGLALVQSAGMKADVKRTGRALRVTFAKSGEERRLLAFAARPADAARLAAAKTLAVRYSLRLTAGAARLALVVFEKGGAAWFGVSARPLAAGDGLEERLRLRSFRKVAFAPGGGKDVDWTHVERVWVGLVLDGQAAGTVELHGAEFTTEPYRPARPLVVPCAAAALWSIAKDAAATAKVTAAKDGPDGSACARIAFAFPGGRHMYVVPTVRPGGAELAGYRAMRLTYKAALPKGIPGLLLMLIERGGAQYFVEPPPPAAADWKTVTIPLDRFRLGRWSRDDNGRLDLNDVRAVAVGVHGTAAEREAKGTIRVADIRLVP